MIRSIAQKKLDVLVILLVVLMPFHAFVSVWLGSVFGYQTLIQAWKEIALILIGLLVLFAHELSLIKAVLLRRVNLAVIAFAALAIVVSFAAGSFNQPGFWYGAKTDLGFLLAFILAQFATSRTRRFALIGFLSAATVVGVFGMLQVLVLPPDFLSRFGYGPDTIEPFRMVDPAVDTIRILSTLSGPNQLGSFLVLPISIMAYLAVRRRQWPWGVAALVCSFTLWNSYSRSALIGLVIALGGMTFIGLSRRWQLGMIGAVALAAILVVSGAESYLLQTNRLEYYLFHGQVFSTGEVKGSDEGRLQNMKAGAELAINQPGGLGLGSAGPASQQNPETVITENYYLQLAIEVGIVGLLLFAAINVLVGMRVWRAQLIPGVPLVAALVGLAVSNLFLHTWADSSTALTFWTIAGLALGEAYDIA